MKHFAKRVGISETQAKRFIKMVNEAAKAQERDSQAKTDRLCAKVDGYAHKLGLSLDWRPGIYPLVKKDGELIHLPD